MAELSNIHKEAIVVALARFRSPTEVAAMLKADFELDLGEHAVQQIVKYDPTRPAFEAGEKWRPIFEAAREAYINDVKLVPAAGQAYRLNTLQEGIEAAKKAKNWRLVADLLEQVAKEVGGVLTNSRDLNINDGRRAKDMTTEDRRSLLGSILAEELAKAKPEAPTIN